MLVQKNKKNGHCCLPGGRIEIGENSEQTIKREMQEELGRKIEIEEYMTTIENFFEIENKKYHELYFLYKIEFEKEADKKIEYTLQNLEGKEYLQYEWLDLDKIEGCNLLPKCLKEVVKTKVFPAHIIHNDLEYEKRIRN